MTENRNDPIHHQRRRGVITVGVGAAAGALLAAALSQPATAPTARADDFTEIVANVEATIAAGQADFTAGQADFALGTPAGFAAGVGESLSGFDFDAVPAPQQALIGLADLAGL